MSETKTHRARTVRGDIREAVKQGPMAVAAYHAARLAKRARLRLSPGRTETKPVFIVGCQRSGTKMLLKTLERAPAAWGHDHRLVDPVFGFGHDPAFAKTPHGTLSRLAPADERRRVFARCPAPVAVVHAIAEAQNTRALLDAHPQARVVWIYRHYADVANSAVRKWGDHQKDVIRRFRDGEWDRLRWRGERVGADTVARLVGAYADDLSAHDGAALFWYLRNHFFAEDGLAAHPRVRLVRYEALVAAPERHFPPVFGFAGLSYHPGLVDHIFASSVRRQPPPPLADSVAALCDELLARLDAHAAPSPPRA